MENKTSLAVESELYDVNVGNHLFVADLVSEEGNARFDIHEFEIVKINKDHLKGGKKVVYELKDMANPDSKAVIKSDLSEGFFHSAQEAKEAFVDYLENVLSIAKGLL